MRPVRPKPVCTSSATNTIPSAAQSERTESTKAGSATRKPQLCLDLPEEALILRRDEQSSSFHPRQHVMSSIQVRLRCVREERVEHPAPDGPTSHLEPYVIYEQSFETLPPGETLRELPLVPATGSRDDRCGDAFPAAVEPVHPQEGPPTPWSCSRTPPGPFSRPVPDGC